MLPVQGWSAGLTAVRGKNYFPKTAGQRAADDQCFGDFGVESSVLYYHKRNKKSNILPWNIGIEIQRGTKTGRVDNKGADEYYMNMNSYSTTTQIATTGNELLTVLRLVAEPTRLQILYVLHERGAHCVSDCQCHLPDISQSLLSHHIAELREAELITAEKEGLKVYYSLTERGRHVVAALNDLKEEYPMNGCTCTNCTCANCNC